MPYETILEKSCQGSAMGVPGDYSAYSEQYIVIDIERLANVKRMLHFCGAVEIFRVGGAPG